MNAELGNAGSTQRRKICFRKNQAWEKNLDIFCQHQKFETVISHSIGNNFYMGLNQKSLVNLEIILLKFIVEVIKYKTSKGENK